MAVVGTGSRSREEVAELGQRLGLLRQGQARTSAGLAHQGGRRQMAQGDQQADQSGGQRAAKRAREGSQAGARHSSAPAGHGAMGHGAMGHGTMGRGTGSQTFKSQKQSRLAGSDRTTQRPVPTVLSPSFAGMFAAGTVVSCPACTNRWFRAHWCTNIGVPTISCSRRTPPPQNK